MLGSVVSNVRSAPNVSTRFWRTSAPTAAAAFVRDRFDHPKTGRTEISSASNRLALRQFTGPSIAISTRNLPPKFGKYHRRGGRPGALRTAEEKADKLCAMPSDLLAPRNQPELAPYSRQCRGGSCRRRARPRTCAKLLLAASDEGQRAVPGLPATRQFHDRGIGTRICPREWVPRIPANSAVTVGLLPCWADSCCQLLLATLKTMVRLATAEPRQSPTSGESLRAACAQS